MKRSRRLVRMVTLDLARFRLGALCGLACLFPVFGPLSGCGGPERPWRPLPEVTDCDAARAVCETVGSGVHVRLRLGPGVRAMHPFPVVLEVPKAHGVVIRFEMPGMDMGKNVYRLDRAAPGRWAGKAILPICLSGRTDWVARVEIERADGRYLAVFPFHVGP